MSLRTDEQKFYAGVRVDAEGCWLWTRAKSGAGYGQLRVAGKVVYAHRFAYELLVGPIPEGLTLDHLCRVRACANPKHLEAVTLRANLLRGTSRNANNARKTHCLRGHPFSGPNLYVRKDGHGRECRACNTIRKRASR